MSWRFRKSFKLLPSVRLNLTPNGLSATVGAAPFSLHAGPKGEYANLSHPGTGRWERRRLDQPSPSLPIGGLPPALDEALIPGPQPSLLPPKYGEVTKIRSAGTEMLRSEGMADFQKLLEEAYEERAVLGKEAAACAAEADIAARRYQSWERGFLLKRVFRRSFSERRGVAEATQAKLDELREQLRLTVLATQIDIDEAQAGPYYKMRDEFAALSECQKVWDTLERRSVDRVVERSAASEAIAREPLAFSLDSCDLIQWEQKVLHLPNRTGGDLYIYPGFVIYRAAKKALAVIDSREIRLAYAPVRFVEEEHVPSDTQVVGQAWAKSNKDGTPDRRFRDNYQIPIVLYGALRFTSPGGLQEEFHFSNAALAERFAHSWNQFQASFAPTDQHAKRSCEYGGTKERPVRPVPQPAECIIESPDAGVVFAKESEKARVLARERGRFWEHLLTEELLRSKLATVEKEYDDFDRTLQSVPKRHFNGPDFICWLNDKMREVPPLVQEIESHLDQDLQSAWGELGEVGDASKILNAVDGVIDCCRRFLAWELEVCAAEPPVNLKRFGAGLRGITASIVGDVKHVADELSRVVEAARAGTREFQIDLAVSTPQQIANFFIEMEKVNKHPEWLTH